MRKRFSNQGFTLVELLVLLGIIVLLMGLLLPAIQKVRALMDRLTCASQVRQLGVALTAYHTQFGYLPAGCSYRDGLDPQPFASWCLKITPFLEHDEIWSMAIRAFQQEKNFKTPVHDALLGRVVKEFTCPSDYRLRQPKIWGRLEAPLLRTAFTSYLGVNGIDQTTKDGMLYLDSKIRFRDVHDGLSHTLLVGERPPSALMNAGWWYAGQGMRDNGAGEMHLGVQERNTYRTDYFYRLNCPDGPWEYGPGHLFVQCHMFHFWSVHQGGAHFLMADGSVHFLHYSAKTVLPALATRAGGEPIHLD